MVFFLLSFVFSLRLTKLETVRFVTVGPLADEIEALCPLTNLRHLEIRQEAVGKLLLQGNWVKGCPPFLKWTSDCL